MRYYMQLEDTQVKILCYLEANYPRHKLFQSLSMGTGDYATLTCVYIYIGKDILFMRDIRFSKKNKPVWQSSLGQ